MSSRHRVNWASPRDKLVNRTNLQLPLSTGLRGLFAGNTLGSLIQWLCIAVLTTLLIVITLAGYRIMTGQALWESAQQRNILLEQMTGIEPTGDTAEVLAHLARLSQLTGNTVDILQALGQPSQPLRLAEPIAEPVINALPSQDAPSNSGGATRIFTVETPVAQPAVQASEAPATFRAMPDTPEATPTAPQSASTERFIEVLPGDTLSQISTRAYGTARAYTLILEANAELQNDPKRLRPGQQLRVPPLPEDFINP